MKVIGLIGGMSWESTLLYYETINQTIKRERGGLHSAKIILYSVDFHEIEQCQSAGDWEASATILIDAGQRLERAGADFILICTNTMHKVAEQMQCALNIPILHIAELTAEQLIASNIDTVGLLGTRYTMEQDFYKKILMDRGINVVIPEPDDVLKVNQIIYDELCLGIRSDRSKKYYLSVVKQLAKKGVQGIILGCTEIGLLLNQEDTAIPLFDTAQIHAIQGALASLAD